MPEVAPQIDAVTGFRDYFRKVFAYDRWANGRVLDAMAELGDRLPERPLNRMSHLVVCQSLWLSRLDHLRPHGALHRDAAGG